MDRPEDTLKAVAELKKGNSEEVKKAIESLVCESAKESGEAQENMEKMVTGVEAKDEGDREIDLSLTEEEVKAMLNEGIGQVLNALQLFAVIHLSGSVEISRSLVKPYYGKLAGRRQPRVNMAELGIDREMFKKGLPSELRFEISARVRDPEAIEYFSYLPFYPKGQNLCNADELQSLIRAMSNALKYMTLAATTDKERVEELLSEYKEEGDELES
jgi:hypothetical protein